MWLLLPNRQLGHFEDTFIVGSIIRRESVVGLVKWAPGYVNLVPHEADICVTITIVEHNVVVVFNWRSFTFSFCINLKHFTPTVKPAVEIGKPCMTKHERCYNEL